MTIRWLLRLKQRVGFCRTIPPISEYTLNSFKVLVSEFPVCVVLVSVGYVGVVGSDVAKNNEHRLAIQLAAEKIASDER